MTYRILCFLLVLMTAACRNNTDVSDHTIDSDMKRVISDWYALMLEADRYTEGFRSPVAARYYAYCGIAGWETARLFHPEWELPGDTFWQDLVIPVPQTGKMYAPAIVLNACYATLFARFFLTAPFTVESQRKDLLQKWTKNIAVRYDNETVVRSVFLGESIGQRIYEWAATDSLGHMGHLHNFDRNYTPPPGEGVWQPCNDFPTPSLLPYWGHVRRFILDTADYLARPLPAFSMDKNSLYYTQALEVYTLHSPLSFENRWIGEFWADDHPGLTFSSSGRWISIANQVIRKEHPTVEKILKTYLLLGITLSDVMVTCWYSKYTYNLLRPETLIGRLFQANWRPVVHTPPFPAYPSGHSMKGAAVAEILTALYGEEYNMEDISHEGRKEFASHPRKYSSFREMSAECSYSRIALGVHYRMDCEEGVGLGQRAGKEILRRMGI